MKNNVSTIIPGQLQRINLQRIQLVIWDCDGVLVDSERLASKAFYNIIQLHGGSPSEQDVYKSLKGGSIYKAIDYVRQQVDVPVNFDIEREYRKLSFELFTNELRAVDGVEKIICSFDKIQCVASNGPRIKIDHNLRLTGLKKYFDDSHIFSGHDIQSFKPDPRLFKLVSETFGVSPEDCLVIEDSAHGAQAAQDAGMYCLGYAYETDPLDFTQFNAKPFNSMEQLLQLF